MRVVVFWMGDATLFVRWFATFCAVGIVFTLTRARARATRRTVERQRPFHKRVARSVALSRRQRRGRLRVWLSRARFDGRCTVAGRRNSRGAVGKAAVERTVTQRLV